MKPKKKGMKRVGRLHAEIQRPAVRLVGDGIWEIVWLGKRTLVTWADVGKDDSVFMTHQDESGEFDFLDDLSAYDWQDFWKVKR